LQAWIDFGEGPLFRFSFVLMLLGLGRIFVLTLVNVAEAYRRSPDKILNYREIRHKTIAWLIPTSRLWRKRPVYSGISFLFHLGLILGPLFLTAHVNLWKLSVGFAWFTLPQGLANLLTLAAIIGALALFLMRVFYSPARALSRRQDYAWPLLLAIPFLTGYLMVNNTLTAGAYQAMMLVHLYTAAFIMLLIPFTKIAHCVLVPLSQLVTAVSWKFPAGTGARVLETLGLSERPTWVDKPRLDIAPVKLPDLIKVQSQKKEAKAS
jgi:nitrate reductase gamma subunit